MRTPLLVASFVAPALAALLVALPACGLLEVAECQGDGDCNGDDICDDGECVECENDNDCDDDEECDDGDCENVGEGEGEEGEGEEGEGEEGEGEEGEGEEGEGEEGEGEEGEGEEGEGEGDAPDCDLSAFLDATSDGIFASDAEIEADPDNIGECAVASDAYDVFFAIDDTGLSDIEPTAVQVSIEGDFPQPCSSFPVASDGFVLCPLCIDFVPLELGIQLDTGIDRSNAICVDTSLL